MQRELFPAAEDTSASIDFGVDILSEVMVLRLKKLGGKMYESSYKQLILIEKTSV